MKQLCLIEGGVAPPGCSKAAIFAEFMAFFFSFMPLLQSRALTAHNAHRL